MCVKQILVYWVLCIGEATKTRAIKQAHSLVRNDDDTVLPEPACGTVWQDWKLQGRHGHIARTWGHHETHSESRELGILGSVCSFLLHKERQNKAGIDRKLYTSKRNKTNKQNKQTQLISFLKLVLLVFLYSETLLFLQGSGFFIKEGILYMAHFYECLYFNSSKLFVALFLPVSEFLLIYIVSLLFMQSRFYFHLLISVFLKYFYKIWKSFNCDMVFAFSRF